MEGASIPVRDIGNYIIKTLSKFDNKDELMLYLDTKKYCEITDTVDKIEEYKRRKVKRFIDNINELIQTDFPELSKYENLKYEFEGTRLAWNYKGYKHYIYWFNYPENEFLHVGLPSSIQGVRISENGSLEDMKSVPLEFKPLLELLIEETSKFF